MRIRLSAVCLALVLILPASAQDDQKKEKPAAAEKKAKQANKKPATDETSRKPARKQAGGRQSVNKQLESVMQRMDQLSQQLDDLRQQNADKASAEEKETAKPKEKPKAVATAAPAPRKADRGKLPNQLTLDDDSLKNIPFRSIGPANMSGRITDIDIHGSDPSLWYVATASGGVLKTTNAGVTLEHQFDDQNTVSIGAIAAAPSDPQIVWVGTGEANPRNSVSYGDGVYKSTDGGKTYQHMGLKESFQTARILIHPENPDVVYVGAAGRLYGTNRERGVYKTTDGGKTWTHSLYVDDKTGVIDMIMHPENPDVVIAAMWDRLRDGFDSWPGAVKKPDGVDGYDPIRKYGPGAGLYKTTDGGETWNKLKNGLPTGMTGRIGLDWQKGGDHTIFAIIDTDQIGKGPKPFSVFLGLVGRDLKKQAVITQVMPKSPAEELGIKPGDVLKEVDGQKIEKYDQILDILRNKKLGQRIALKLNRGKKELKFETRVAPRPGSNQQMPTVWLGVTGTNADGNVMLNTVVANSPAAKAGLKKDDILKKVAGKPADDYDKLIKMVQGKDAGEEIAMTVQRGDETLDIKVTLANRPVQQRQTARSNAYMGIQGSDNEGGGALLTVVTEGGPSAKAGLKAKDVVVKIQDKKVDSYNALISNIRSRQPKDKMKVTVKRGDKEVTATVELGDRRGGGNSDRPYTYSYYGQTPNVQDQQGANGHDYGGIYKSTDAGETWERVNSLNTRPMYFSVIKVDPNDDQRLYVLGVSQFRSVDGGKTFTSDFGRGVHADAHDLWVDPADGRHMVIAGDGGFYATWDYGSTWDHINTAAIGQFYHVAISNKQPYWVVGGLQDNGTWAGPAISQSGGAINEDWISVSGGDGFQCQVDPDNPDLMYYESQNGNMGRRDLMTGERASIRPARQQGTEYRFNWNTPFALSKHNSRIFYTVGNFVFRSLDRGSRLQKISPELTRTKRGSGTAFAESSRNPAVLYAGTDDGALWVTKDGGTTWNDISKNLGTDPHWINSIEASRFVDGRVYVVMDSHRTNDDNPYVFVSEDYGQSFAPLHKGLPWGTTRVLREDIRNQNLLYLGTEFGFWVSVDRGQSWSAFNQQLPKVAIHEIAQHPTNGEIVLATHGRSLWAGDVSALRAVDSEKLKSEIAFYDPRDVIRWRRKPTRGRTSRRYVAQNPSTGAHLWYSLPKDVKKAVLKVEDVEGKLISELPANTKAGLHRTTWNMTSTASNRGQGRTRQATPGRRGFGGRPVPNGSYKVTLVVEDKPVQSHVVALNRDPNLPSNAVADEVYETMLMEDQYRSEMKSKAKAAGMDVYSDD